MARIPAELDIHTIAVVRPGDKLVVAVSRPVTMMERDEIKHRLEAQLPGVQVVPVWAAALAVYRS